MCEQKQFEQNVRLMIVRDLLQLNQGSDADFIIKQATALSDFVLDGAYKATQCPKNPLCVRLLLGIGDKE